jgi:hypothetical protein
MGLVPDEHVGPFKVIRSQGSGLYYIGTMVLCCGETTCDDCGDRHEVPFPAKGQELDYNSRETDYFKNEQEAKDALATYKKTGVLHKMRY